MIKLFRRKPKRLVNVFNATPDEILDSWADMLGWFMKLTPADVDANGVSDQAETVAKIDALRAGAKALRGQAQ